MRFAVFAWLIIFVLVVISLWTNKVPFWIPIVLYMVLVSVRAVEIIGNYRDMEKKSDRDEKLQLDEKVEEMAGRGLASSSIRNQEEKRIKEDFEFERKKVGRKLWTDLINTLFLK